MIQVVPHFRHQIWIESHKASQLHMSSCGFRLALWLSTVPTAHAFRNHETHRAVARPLAMQACSSLAVPRRHDPFLVLATGNGIPQGTRLPLRVHTYSLTQYLQPWYPQNPKLTETFEYWLVILNSKFCHQLLQFFGLSLFIVC